MKCWNTLFLFRSTCVLVKLCRWAIFWLRTWGSKMCVCKNVCVCTCVCVCVCVCTCMLVQGPAGTYKHRLAVMCLLLLGSGKVEGNSHSSTLLLEILVNAWQDEESGKQVRVWEVPSLQWARIVLELSHSVLSWQHNPTLPLYTLGYSCPGFSSWPRGSLPEAPSWPRALSPQAEPLTILWVLVPESDCQDCLLASLTVVSF